MARVALITVYDTIAVGLRTMTKLLNQNGHHASLLFLKDHIFLPIPFSEPQNINYECLQDGVLMGTNYDVAPWTSHEVSLLIATLKELQPEIIGFGARSPLDTVNVELLGEIRRHFPETVMIAGGYGPSLRPEAYLSQTNYVMFGESDYTFLDFANRFDRQEDLDTVGNLIYRKADGSLQHNQLAKVESVLENLPFPLYDDQCTYYINENMVFHHDPALRRNTYSLLTGRGCIGKCSYCTAGQWSQNYQKAGGVFPKIRQRGVDSIIAELKEAKAMGFGHIQFIDPYFTGSSDFLITFLREYAAQIGLPFTVALHMGQILAHPEILDLAIAGGLQSTTIGIQHGSERFAKKIYSRTLSNQVIIDAARTLINKGVHFEYHAIVDNPLETEKDFAEYLQLFAELPFAPELSSICVFRLKNFPNTPLTQQIQALPPAQQQPGTDWVYQGMLLSTRVLVDDRTFQKISAAELFRENPMLLQTLYPDLLLQKTIAGEEIVYKQQNLAPVYQYHAARHNQQAILLWGSGGLYEQLKPLFRKNKVMAIIDNNHAQHGEKKDGIPICGAEILAEHTTTPLFICSTHKKAIVKQIRQDYSHFRGII